MLREPSLTSSAVAVVTVSLLGTAAAAAAPPRVGVLKSAELAPYAQVVAGFSSEVRGQVEERVLGEGAEAAGQAVRELMARSPQLVLAVGPAAAVAARRQIADVPVLFVMVPSHQRYDLEGANSTGIALTSDFTLELDALRAALPRVRRVGVVSDPRFSAKLVEGMASVARERELSVVSIELDGPQRLERALEQAKGKLDALVIVADKTVGSAAVVERIIAFAAQARLPVVGLTPAQVKQGALFAAAPSPLAMGQQAGRIASRILVERIDPGALAVVPPEGVELHFNLGVARKLGDAGAIATGLLGLTARRGLPLRTYE